MDNNGYEFDIEISDVKKVEDSNNQLPYNFIRIGEIQRNELQIYIKQDVYKQIEKHSKTDTSKELGGILIGKHLTYLEKSYVVISAYIEARFTDSSSSTLTFTHKSWEYIHSEHNRLHADKKIVGWHHTHPNYGIFLSGHDMFIHENFFNLPWQIAYVVDPIENTRGFFQWQEGKVTKVSGFYIYDDGDKNIGIKNVDKKEKESLQRQSSKVISIILSMAIVVLAGMQIFNILYANKIEKQLIQSKKQQEELQIISNTNKETVDKLNNKREELVIKIENLQKQIKKSEKNTMPNTNETLKEYVMLKKYVVKKGDNITLICQKMGIDYYAMIDTIKSINKIEDEDKIFEGQTILIPVNYTQE